MSEFSAVRGSNHRAAAFGPPKKIHKLMRVNDATRAQS
jgi:hypothetical protein